MALDISLQEAIEVYLNNALSDLHTSFPGEIVSYDSSAQTASVRPMVRRPSLAINLNEETDSEETLPILPNVPVVQPRGGSTNIHLPVSAGDSVWIIVCMYDVNSWRSTGGISSPSVSTTHGLQSVFAIPGAFHANQVLGSSNVSSTDIKIVNDSHIITVTSTATEVGGNSDAAAKASSVDDQLNDLKTAINGWAPVSNDGGAALKTALTTWLADVANTSSSKLKIGG